MWIVDDYGIWRLKISMWTQVIRRLKYLLAVMFIISTNSQVTP